ncbi:hypothetical protein [Embleya sp. AB8]|uniref:hypothetical protein n=1 Tax=Embleya sp. AB8 TaxID=3156304 RepID=UPI003C782251
MQAMHPCPNCGGSGGNYDGGGPTYAPPRAPRTGGARLKYTLGNMICVGGLAAYLYYRAK